MAVMAETVRKGSGKLAGMAAVAAVAALVVAAMAATGAMAAITWRDLAEMEETEELVALGSPAKEAPADLEARAVMVATAAPVSGMMVARVFLSMQAIILPISVSG